MSERQWRPRQRETPKDDIDTLNRQEFETLRFLSRGLETHEIAEVLGLSFHTVKDYRRLVYAKLGTRNAVEAARKAWEAGIK
jgi:DNA-binding NarL/FixJ family response regulator